MFKYTIINPIKKLKIDETKISSIFEFISKKIEKEQS
jgi:hypothetical protein